MAGASYRLVMRSGPTPGKVFPVQKDEVIIGRDLTNDIVINDAEISRRHSRLSMQAGGYAIEDLGSTNGTMVNGQRLTSPYALHSGEMILLGEHVSLVFEAEQVDANATVASSAPRQPAFTPPPAAAPQAEPLKSYSGQVPPFSAAQSPIQTPTPLAPAPKKKFPVWVIIVIVLVVLCCLCLVAAYFLSGQICTLLGPTLNSFGYTCQ